MPVAMSACAVEEGESCRTRKPHHGFAYDHGQNHHR